MTTKSDQLTVENEENVVFIGKKDDEKYVTTVLAQSSVHGAVILKARGLMISKAADVALCADRLSKYLTITEVNLSTTPGKRIHDDVEFVSVIEIIMERP